MLCEKCGKNHATTHIKTVINGKISEYNLCALCAAKEGYASNSLAGVLASMLGSAADSAPIQAKCSVCGASFSDIAKSGKVGCSECYSVFYNELLPYLKRVHGSTKHSGKVPQFEQPQEKTVDHLKNELKRLVAEENYEQAAVIRDKIKEMEGKADE